MNNLPAPAAPSSTTSSTTTSAVAEIIVLHSGIITAARKTLDTGIRIGELLVEQKSKLRHGLWLSWVKENLPFDVRTAQNYTRVYDRREELKNESVSHLGDAYRILCGREPEADSKLPPKAKSIRGLTIDVECSVVTTGAPTGNPCAPPPLVEHIVDFGQQFGVDPEPEPELMKPEPMLSTDREAVANSFREWLNQWRDVPGVREIVSDILRGTAA